MAPTITLKGMIQDNGTGVADVTVTLWEAALATPVTQIGAPVTTGADGKWEFSVDLAVNAPPFDIKMVKDSQVNWIKGMSGVAADWLTTTHLTLFGSGATLTIPDNLVTNAMIASLAASKITGTLGTSQIADSAVTQGKLGSNAKSTHNFYTSASYTPSTGTWNPIISQNFTIPSSRSSQGSLLVLGGASRAGSAVSKIRIRIDANSIENYSAEVLLPAAANGVSAMAARVVAPTTITNIIPIYVQAWVDSGTEDFTNIWLLPVWTP